MMEKCSRSYPGLVLVLSENDVIEMRLSVLRCGFDADGLDKPMRCEQEEDCPDEAKTENDKERDTWVHA
jgi:hypothetical protein